MFIDNEWYDAESQQTYEDFNPATEKVIIAVPDGSKVCMTLNSFVDVELIWSRLFFNLKTRATTIYDWVMR